MMKNVEKKKAKLVVGFGIIIAIIFTLAVAIIEKMGEEPQVPQYAKIPVDEERFYQISHASWYPERVDESEEKTIWQDEVRDGWPVVRTDYGTLEEVLLPDSYINIDFSTFQPFMDWECIKDKTSTSYQFVHGNNSDTYSDEFGLIRKEVADGKFNVNGEDDIVVALGNYYKEKGTVGQRFLVVTSTGFYTIVVGGEKSDNDTGDLRMYSTHGEYAGLIEFIVDDDKLSEGAWATGSMKACGHPILAGDILAMYKITERSA